MGKRLTNLAYNIAKKRANIFNPHMVMGKTVINSSVLRICLFQISNMTHYLGVSLQEGNKDEKAEIDETIPGYHITITRPRKGDLNKMFQDEYNW
jgi:hypothetical protein